MTSESLHRCALLQGVHLKKIGLNLFIRLFAEMRQCCSNNNERYTVGKQIECQIFYQKTVVFNLLRLKRNEERWTHRRGCERWRFCYWRSTDCKCIDPNLKISLAEWADKMLWYLPSQLSLTLRLERCRNLSPVTNSRASLKYFQAS